MALFDRIKFDATDDSQLVWKFQSEKIPTGSQLIVSSTQECVFRNGGKNADVFLPGTHTLSSSNLPILAAAINLPFGGKTPFSAEIWYINKTPKRDLKWGTSAPIPLIDPKFNLPISVRAFGQWGIQVVDSLIFLEEMVGTRSLADSSQIYEYFRGELIQYISEAISTAISQGLSSLFTINADLTALSNRTSERIEPKLLRYGVRLTNFSIDRISIPHEEMQKVQGVMLKKMEVEQLGSAKATDDYKTIKTLDILETAAGNESGGVAPLFAQAGLGAALGAAVAAQTTRAALTTSDDFEAKLTKLKALLDKGLITQADYDEQKSRLLASM